MGVKDLWSILTPYAERKPICDLRGKIVAIDLAGWVCESLNVVDYFVHPQHHLKNLFFRTCYLIWEEVTPVFVLEGVAPKLKRQVIKKRNELQFRGVEPKKKSAKVNAKVQCDKAGNTSKNSDDRNVRTRFNWVLKQCERLLRVMGIECVQGPGEAEAYCAYLNQKGLVHGVVSQDSDCFAYGAVRVYRNFSISNQGAMAAQGGALDIYDMDIIRSKIDFGQNKVIAMALLCGCDYCPDGIGGVGRDSVLKLFNRYKDNEILQLLRRWRLETGKYAALELRLTDKNVCRNCGHMGRTQCHTKKGCDLCCTKQGCDNTLWKEERLALKAEVLLRQKAIANPTFPCENIIQEFLSQPTTLPKLTLKWHQPDLIKFVKQIGELLQWTEIYCFQKFFPILTRWHVQNIQYIKQETSSNVIYVSPKEILKKRIVKGLPSLEIMWEDERHYFDNLIPEEQIQELNDIDSLWKTIEPLNLMQSAYPDLVATFLKSQEKPKKITRRKLITTTSATITKSKKSNVNSLENLNDLLAAAEDMENKLKSKKSRKCKKPLQKDSHLIEKYFQRRLKEHKKSSTYATSIEKHQILCSTPLNKDIKFAVEQESMNESDFDMSEIINNIVYKTEPIFNQLNNHEGQSLFYEILSQNVSELTKEPFLNDDLKCVDDLVLLKSKRSLSMSFITSIQHPQTKRIALDDSFDVLVKMGNKNHSNVYDKFLTKDNLHKTILDHSKAQEYSHITSGNGDNLNQADVSYFFNNDYQDGDAFEKCMEISYVQHFENDYYVENDDLIVLSE